MEAVPRSMLGEAGTRRDVNINGVSFASFCRCNYKAFLMSTGAVGHVSDYELARTEADDRFRTSAIARLIRQHERDRISRQPPSLSRIVEEGNELILGATAEALGIALTLDVIERHTDRHDERQP